ncbi:MAG: flagellar hook-length control protein FliK [Planctomyces sp.]|nr:flagellar hook-length control protein FliK [Planctomyces sp.]
MSVSSFPIPGASSPDPAVARSGEAARQAIDAEAPDESSAGEGRVRRPNKQPFDSVLAGALVPMSGQPPVQDVAATPLVAAAEAMIDESARPQPVLAAAPSVPAATGTPMPVRPEGPLAAAGELPAPTPETPAHIPAPDPALATGPAPEQPQRIATSSQPLASDPIAAAIAAALPEVQTSPDSPIVMADEAAPPPAPLDGEALSVPVADAPPDANAEPIEAPATLPSAPTAERPPTSVRAEAPVEIVAKAGATESIVPARPAVPTDDAPLFEMIEEVPTPPDARRLLEIRPTTRGDVRPVSRELAAPEMAAAEQDSPLAVELSIVVPPARRPDRGMDERPSPEPFEMNPAALGLAVPASNPAALKAAEQALAHLSGNISETLPSRISRQVSSALLARETELAPQGREGFELVLDPPELGRLFISLSRTGGGLEVRIAAENDHVRAILENSGAELQQSLQMSGFSLGQSGTPSQSREDLFRDMLHVNSLSRGEASRPSGAPTAPAAPVRSRLNVVA